MKFSGLETAQPEMTKPAATQPVAGKKTGVWLWALVLLVLLAWLESIWG